MLDGPMLRISCLTAAATLLAAGAALAQVNLVPPPGGGGGVAPPTPASRPSPLPSTTPAATGPSSTSVPTAESVLQGLLRDKAEPDRSTATAPNNAGSAGPTLGSDGLLREGEKIELRAGHLLRQDGGTMLFAFDSKEQPAYPPMAIIPSRRRAALEDAAGFSDNRNGADMTFRISAEVTQYRGKNYLYIKPIGVPLPVPAKAPASAPAPAIGPQAAAELAPPAQAAPMAPAIAHHPEETLIINRTGRLVRDTKTGMELFVLDGDGKQMADPPMGVIPCKLLALMEDATDYGAKSQKFHISGEVTLYRGRNFLYLKAMSAVIDLHQGIVPGLGGS
jgi:hypothetical protein